MAELREFTKMISAKKKQIYILQTVHETST